jgi:pimeloyl-ACP methyl ester carboxylesterase
MEEPVLSSYQILAFDRAGWGQTMGNSGQVIPSLEFQADILAAAIRPMNLKSPTILVAHSWGGPVALALAIYHPDLVDGMLLIASPGNPEISQPRWYHKLAKAKPIQWIIGKSMTRSNQEMLALDRELEKLMPNLNNISVPTVIMQGKKDWLVKPENAFFLNRNLENANVKLVYDTKANHFIPFSQTDKVALEVMWLHQQIDE